MVSRTLLVVALLLQGCFLFHGADDDDGTAEDGGLADGGEPMCAPIGPYPACGEVCEPGCLEGFPDCHNRERCGDTLACAYDYGVCRSQIWPNENAGFRIAGLMDGGDNNLYCTRVEAGAISLRGLDIDPTDPAQTIRGTCLDFDYCRSENLARVPYPVECYYSDRTPVLDRPPVEACPVSPSEKLPFCGTTCAGCVVSDDQIVPEPSCIGLNEERGIGLCTYSLGCGPGHLLLDPDNVIFFESMGFDEPVSCLAFVREGIVDEWGWVTSLAGCRAYRDLYPGAVDCMDYDWNPVP